VDVRDWPVARAAIAYRPAPDAVTTIDVPATVMSGRCPAGPAQCPHQCAAGQPT
jgi:hypothetical protein